MSQERLDALSRICCRMYTFDDVIEHLEEECLELLLAIKRVKREKESTDSFFEELTDVTIECNTVFELCKEWAPKLDEMRDKKLDKFAAMLKKDKSPLSGKIQRYRSLEDVLNEIP